MYKTMLLGGTLLAVSASSWGISARAQNPGWPAASGFVEPAKTPLMTADYVLDNTNAQLSQPLINTGKFIVGDVGSAQLNVSNGGGIMTTPRIGRTGAIIGAAPGSNGYVRLHAYNGSNAGAFQVGGDLLVGQYGVGELFSGGYTVVQGNLEVGVHGSAAGTVVMADRETGSVQGQTLLGVDPGAYGELVRRLGRYGQSSFNYGSQLQVGVHGAATVRLSGTGTLAPTAGAGPGTIIIGSQDASTNWTYGNSIVIQDRSDTLTSTVLAGTMIIHSSTHLSTAYQQNLLEIGFGGKVVLSEALVLHDNTFVYIQGGELDVPQITFLGSAQIIGTGMVNGPILNGHVTAGGRGPFPVYSSNAPLTIGGEVSGPNSVLTIGFGTLTLLAAVGGDVHVDFSPSSPRSDLQLFDPAEMGGLISNFAPGDNIELLNKLVVTHAYHDHGDGTGALSLTFSDGTFAQLNFVGTYTSTMFHVIADGTTGTRVYLR